MEILHMVLAVRTYLALAALCQICNFDDVVVRFLGPTLPGCDVQPNLSDPLKARKC